MSHVHGTPAAAAAFFLSVVVECKVVYRDLYLDGRATFRYLLIQIALLKILSMVTYLDTCTELVSLLWFDDPCFSVSSKIARGKAKATTFTCFFSSARSTDARSYQLIQRIVLRRYLSVVDPNGFPAEFVSVCTTPVAPTAAAVARYTLGRSLSLPAYL